MAVLCAWTRRAALPGGKIRAETGYAAGGKRRTGTAPKASPVQGAMPRSGGGRRCFLADGSLPGCPSFCDQKEAKSPTVSMRWTPTRVSPWTRCGHLTTAYAGPGGPAQGMDFNGTASGLVVNMGERDWFSNNPAGYFPLHRGAISRPQKIFFPPVTKSPQPVTV